MIVVTENGFVRLAGCYQVVVIQTGFGIGPHWTVDAIWMSRDGAATLCETGDEAEAHRIAGALAEVACGDTGDKERRIDVRDLI
jgi:hypothetical protein